jgi:hypothetical protein
MQCIEDYDNGIMPKKTSQTATTPQHMSLNEVSKLKKYHKKAEAFLCMHAMP